MSLTNVSNHFYNYAKSVTKKHTDANGVVNTAKSGTPVIFVVLDDEYLNLSIECISKLKEKVEIIPVIITDVKEKNVL
jgi:hypothetical protein